MSHPRSYPQFRIFSHQTKNLSHIVPEAASNSPSFSTSCEASASPSFVLIHSPECCRHPHRSRADETHDVSRGQHHVEVGNFLLSLPVETSATKMCVSVLVCGCEYRRIKMFCSVRCSARSAMCCQLLDQAGSSSELLRVRFFCLVREGI